MHTCDNPECNNPNHLRQGTVQDNIADREAKGRWGAGGRNKETLLKEHEVVELKLMLQAGYSHVEVAKTFSVTRSHILQIASGKFWPNVNISHIPPIEKLDRTKYVKAGSNVPTAKLDEMDVTYIKKELNKGTARSTLAEMFNVTKGCIDAIAQERTWAHIKV